MPHHGAAWGYSLFVISTGPHRPVCRLSAEEPSIGLPKAKFRTFASKMAPRGKPLPPCLRICFGLGTQDCFWTACADVIPQNAASAGAILLSYSSLQILTVVLIRARGGSRDGICAVFRVGAAKTESIGLDYHRNC